MPLSHVRLLLLLLQTSLWQALFPNNPISAVSQDMSFKVSVEQECQ